MLINYINEVRKLLISNGLWNETFAILPNSKKAVRVF